MRIFKVILVIVIMVGVLGVFRGGLYAQECSNPNILVLLDKSGSMRGTKWTQAKNAMQYLMDTYGSQARWGLSLFASDSNCAAGIIDVGCAENTATAIMNKINSVSPDSNTPIGRTLVAVNQYSGIHDSARLNFVILITDGQPNCDPDATNYSIKAAGALYASGVKLFVIGFGSGVNPTTLNNMANAGGSGTYYQADNQQQLQSALDTIVTLATKRVCYTDCGSGYESCINGEWKNCTAPTSCCVDTNDTCNTGLEGVCGIGRMRCVDGRLTCVQVNFPTEEECNLLDDNCNGSIDDGIAPKVCFNSCGHQGTQSCVFGNWTKCNAAPCCIPTYEPCNTGKLGVCAEGRMLCVDDVLTCVQSKQPTVEICDGFDNDCDGRIDNDIAPRDCTNFCGHQGKQECVNGVWSKCDAPPCCIDTNAPCNTGEKGICAEGRMICVDDVLTCVRVNEPLPYEICDGKDNNCDGEVDEGNPGGGAACDTGKKGICAAGTITCVGGALRCIQDNQPSVEICDGKDNDCNGVADENNPGGGRICATGGKGECSRGHTRCDSMAGEVVCDPDKTPIDEICDGLDNDCDGEIDNGVLNNCGGCGPEPDEICNGKDENCNGIIDDGAPCPPGKYCFEGECVAPCQAGECPEGLECVNGYCVGPCKGKVCKPEEDCIDGVCVDKCEGVACEDNYRCWHGECLPDNCYEIPCEDGKVCKNYDCIDDPCRDVTCDKQNAEFCVDGECKRSCARLSCEVGKRCVYGECVDDPCAFVECDSEGEICSTTGECIENRCDEMKCDKGFVCIDNKCVEDPCNNIKCPFEAEICRNGQCVSSEVLDGGRDGGLEDASEITDGDTGYLGDVEISDSLFLDSLSDVMGTKDTVQLDTDMSDVGDQSTYDVDNGGGESSGCSCSSLL